MNSVRIKKLPPGSHIRAKVQKISKSQEKNCSRYYYDCQLSLVSLYRYPSKIFFKPKFCLKIYSFNVWKLIAKYASNASSESWINTTLLSVEKETSGTF